MYERLEFWKGKGFEPSVIYDIGAHNGGWTQEMKKLFPMSQFILFEANAEHQPALQDLSANIVLLGSESREAIPFYKNTAGCTTGNSIYCEKTIYFTSQMATIEYLPMTRLDAFVAQKNLPIPDFMKLDVQGAELDVLIGAGDLLKSLKGCVLEASLHQYNQNAPSIEDSIIFMKMNGFCLIDIVELHKVNGYVVQADLFFAHSSVGLRKEHFYDGFLKFE
jgi:FkbM family methyltransferase